MGNSEDRVQPAASDPAPDLTVIVPVYNEANGAREALESILDATASLEATTEVIAVDDGSTDGTSDMLATFGSEVRLVSHEENRGYGAALKSGTERARGAWICILDADGTYPVDRLSDLWSRCRPPVDMVIGARTRPGAKIPLIRRPAKWALRQFASLLTGHRIADLNSGFRIYRRAAATSFLSLLPDGFSFTSTLTIAFLSDGLRVVFVPIDYLTRSGKSKIRPIRNTYEFFMLVLRTGVFFAPLRFFAPLGFGFMLSSAVLVAYRAFVGAAFGVVTVILFVTGLQLLALGLLADLVNRRLPTSRPK